MHKIDSFKNGVIDGIPICLGYLTVSFTFGIMARNCGLSVWEAVLISATNLTSAGQFAGLSLITASATYMEMAFTQLIINLRYCLMSCSLSQKLDTDSAFFHRFFISYSVTDEIFGVSVCRPGKISPFYSYGVTAIAAPGWILGTFLGVISGNLLPARITSALSIALYGMFIAIIIPPARENKTIAYVVIISMVLSLLFTVTPILRSISSGFRIIILTILIAGVAAVISPIENKDTKKEGIEYEA